MNRREAISMVAGIGIIPAEVVVDALAKTEEEQVIALVLTFPEDSDCEIDVPAWKEEIKGTPLELSCLFLLPHGHTLEMLKLPRKEVDKMMEEYNRDTKGAKE